MISTALMGRLGNQLFQIAAAEALAKRVGTSAAFNLSSSPYRDTLLRNVKHSPVNQLAGRFRETGFGHREIPVEDDLLLTGYFQSEKYFLDCSDYIRDLFYIDGEDVRTVKGEFMTVIGKGPITSVHVRRGDYVNYPTVHPVCGLDYYTKAMGHLQGNTFIVVSDDMGWVRDNFKGDNIIYSPFGSDVLDLTLMTCSDNNIIANSSFSWWGAYLNRNPTRKVVAPMRWFGEDGPQEQDDIVPVNWTKL